MVFGGVALMLVGAIFLFGLPFYAQGNNPPNVAWNPVSSVAIGLILGFLGFVILIAGLAASREQPTRQTFVVGQGQASPGGEEVPEEGARDGDVVATNPSSPVTIWDPKTGEERPSSGAAHFCPECGWKSPTEAKFCQKCGKRMPPPP